MYKPKPSTVTRHHCHNLDVFEEICCSIDSFIASLVVSVTILSSLSIFVHHLYILAIESPFNRKTFFNSMPLPPLWKYFHTIAKDEHGRLFQKIKFKPVLWGLSGDQNIYPGISDMNGCDLIPAESNDEPCINKLTVWCHWSKGGLMLQTCSNSQLVSIWRCSPIAGWWLLKGWAIAWV